MDDRKERIIRALEAEIEKYRKINQDLMAAPKTGVPSWTEIEQNRGYILGLRSAIMMIEKESQMGEIRDCENCVNHTDNGCKVWECKFEAKKEEGDNSEDNS